MNNEDIERFKKAFPVSPNFKITAVQAYLMGKYKAPFSNTSAVLNEWARGVVESLKDDNDDLRAAIQVNHQCLLHVLEKLDNMVYISNFENSAFERRIPTSGELYQKIINMKPMLDNANDS